MLVNIILVAIIIIIVSGIVGFYFIYDQDESTVIIEEPDIILEPEETQLKKFTSEQELHEFLRNIQVGNNSEFMPRLAVNDSIMAEQASDFKADTINSDFSSTNIQVSGIDEPDFLKTDGKYIYIIKERNLVIIDAYPAENAKIVSKVGLDIKNQHLQNMFLNEDRLVIFYHGSDTKEIIPEFKFKPEKVWIPTTHVVIIDISDRTQPVIVKEYQVDGDFRDARMNGNYVYFVSTMWINYHSPTIPRIMDPVLDNIILEQDIFYFDDTSSNYNFSTITSFNIFDESDVNSVTFLMDYARTIYASHDGFYIVGEKHIPRTYYEEMKSDVFFNVIIPLLPPSIQDSINQETNWHDIADVLNNMYSEMSDADLEELFDKIDIETRKYESEKMIDVRQTIIHKILVDEGNLKYQATGEVAGWLLNQFSMDEYNDRLRVATTNERFLLDGWSTYNSVYMLDSNDLSIVGSIKDLAPNESVFSARFMGDKLYLVTFERIDPFFVIDLSTDQPKVLGELKIPGFSNYLHPYDNNHIIGIGKDTKEVDGFVTQLGVKLALFDVSDVKNPRVLDDVIIGDNNTYSPVLDNHKAFLFDKDKNILSIPINTIRGWIDTDVLDTWNGFYVYNIDTQDGFTLKGKIDHLESMNMWNYNVRSLYINDILYTISMDVIKMNELDNVENQINAIELGASGGLVKYIENLGR